MTEVKTAENALRVILNMHGDASLHFMDVQSSNSQGNSDVYVRIRLDRGMYITFSLNELEKYARTR